MIRSEELDALLAKGATAADIVEAYKAALRSPQGSRAITHELRTAVLERDGFACVYCGATDRPLFCDHVVPYSRGGRTVLDNLAASCKPCNSAKKDRTPQEWRGA